MVVVTSFIFLGKASKKRIGEMLKKYRDPYAVIKRWEEANYYYLRFCAEKE